MRSFPSCWNKTLTQLGFKRKRRKCNKGWDRYRRRSLFESLEPRQMLAADVIVTSQTPVVSEGLISTINFSTVGPGVDVDYWDINWGDGSPTQRIDNGNVTTADHQYATPGSYPVTVTATDQSQTQLNSANLHFGDSNGDVILDFNDAGEDDRALSAVVQDDGKIVVAGYTSDPTNGDSEFALARFHADGTLDNTFGDDDPLNPGKQTGMLTQDFAGGDDRAHSVALQIVDGETKIVVSGYAVEGGNKNFALARYNADGTLDDTFGEDDPLNPGKQTGMNTVDFDGGDDLGWGLKIQPDNKIVLGGVANGSTGGNNFAATRFTIDGMLDNSFDGNGKLTYDVTGNTDIAYDVLLQQENNETKIVLVGIVYPTTSQSDYGLVRFDEDGSLDTTFGGHDGDVQGEVITNVSGSGQWDTTPSAAIQDDGKLVVGGFSYEGTSQGNNFSVVRYEADGSLDLPFGPDDTGKVTTNMGGNDQAYSVTVDPVGNIIVGGRSRTAGGSTNNFAVARFDTEGDTDISFENNGEFIYDFFGQSDSVEGIAFAPDGGMILAGVADKAVANGGDKDFALKKLPAVNELVVKTAVPVYWIDENNILHIDDSTSNSDQIVVSTVTSGTNDFITINGMQTAITVNYVEGINILGGSGDDLIDLSQLNSSNLADLENDDITIDAGEGNDTVTGSAFDDTILGGIGNDILSGSAGNDNLYGEEGNDLLLEAGTGTRDWGNSGGVRDSIIVTTEQDEHDVLGTSNFTLDSLSLRESLASVAAQDGVDTIEFDAPLAGQTIELDHGELLVDSEVTITGLGANLLTIDGQQQSRIFNVASGNSVEITDLTIANGEAGAGFGGGILSAGDLTLRDISIRDNNATRGGAIDHQGGTLSLERASVLDNTAGGGGGIVVENSSLTILDSTIARNTATAVVGGIWIDDSFAQITNTTISTNTSNNGSGGGAYVSGLNSTVTMTNATVADNVINSGDGGGIAVQSLNTVILKNTIVADNSLLGIQADDVFGDFDTSSSYNFIGLLDSNSTGLDTDPNTLTGDPLLDNLGDYGGPTLTQALMPNSSAIDAGNNSLISEPYDQRGTSFERDEDFDNNGPTGFTVDVGAFEYQLTPPIPGIDTVVVNEDGATTLNPLGNDVDPGGGTLAIVDFTAASNGTVTDNPDDTFTYAPDPHFHGSDSFTYSINDGQGSTVEVVVNVTVTPINDGPVAANDTATVVEDGWVELSMATLLSNDTDIDLDSLSISAFDVSTMHGIVSEPVPGTLRYTPNAEFFGSDAFTYTVTDGNGGSATGIVNVTVNADNDAPTIGTDNFTIDQNAKLLIDIESLLINDTDIEGDSLAFVSAADVVGGNGTVTDLGDGTLLFEHTALNTDPASFEYTIFDGTNNVTGTVDVTVNALPATLGSISGLKFHDNDVTNGIRDTDLIAGDSPSVVFVIDVSGSVGNPFSGASVGDVNNDGDSDEILDAELAGFVALNQHLIDLGYGNSAEVSIVVFGSDAIHLDMDPSDSDRDIATNPNAMLDVGGQMVNAVEALLQNVVIGGFRGLEAAPAESLLLNTNFEDALDVVIDILDPPPLGGSPSLDESDNVIFLSDGEPTVDNTIGQNEYEAFLDEVDYLENGGTNIRAFGIGLASDAYALGDIDGGNTVAGRSTEFNGNDAPAFQFQSTDELLAVFSGSQGPQTGFTEHPLSGREIYLDLNEDGIHQANEPLTTTDANGEYSFTGLKPDTYHVREKVPTGWAVTGPTIPDGSDFHTIVITAAGEDRESINFGNVQAPYASIAVPSITEGDSGNTVVDIAVSMNNGTIPAPVTVEFEIVGLTADGSDFVVASDTVVIGAGTTGVTFNGLEIIGDNLVELDETLWVRIEGVSSTEVVGYETAPAIVTIADNDQTAIEWDETTVAVNENGNSATLQLNLDKPVDEDIEVTYRLISGTASAGEDFDPVEKRTIIIPKNQLSSSPITIDINDDSRLELTESFTVVIDSIKATNPNVSIGTSSIATITINDDDVADATVTASPPVQFEGDANRTIYTLDVVLSSPVDAPVVVRADMAPTLTNGATPGDDYQTISSLVTFEPGGPLTQQVEIVVLGDTQVEANEGLQATLTVESSGGRPVTVGTPSSTTSTIDNDDSASVSISDVTKLEGTGGTTDFVFDVTLDQAVQGGFDLSFTVNDGTATDADDFDVITTGPLTFAGTAGEIQQIVIRVDGDTDVEVNEQFTISLTGISGLAAGIDPADITLGVPATGTIQNDDVNITLIENSDFVEDYETSFDILANQALQITYSELGFDESTSGDINDVFELALLDQNGNSVVPTIGDGADAFFSIYESLDLTESTLLAPGVTHNSTSGIVTVDLTHLAATIPGDASDDLRLVARLVNNDADDTTTVKLFPDPVFVTPVATFDDPAGPSLLQSNQITEPFDVNDLDDVTAYFDVDYTHTSLDETDGILRAGLTLTHNGPSTVVRGSLVAVIKNLRWQDTNNTNPIDFTAWETDGVTANGDHFFDLSSLAYSPTDDRLVSGDMVEGSELVFRVPTEERFDYNLEIRGHLNDAPYFTNTPVFFDAATKTVRIHEGTLFKFDANGADPENDNITFSLSTSLIEVSFLNQLPGGVSADGIVVYDSSIGEEGSITLRVTDEFGAYSEQTFNIELDDFNRPPEFIAPTPAVDAYANTRYVSTAHAFDIDYDAPLEYVLASTSYSGIDGDDLAIDSTTGEITWTPRYDQVGQSVPVTLEVYDDRAGEPTSKDTYIFTIQVHPDPENTPPVIISDPIVEHVLPHIGEVTVNRADEGAPTDFSVNPDQPILVSFQPGDGSQTFTVDVTRPEVGDATYNAPGWDDPQVVVAGDLSIADQGTLINEAIIQDDDDFKELVGEVLTLGGSNGIEINNVLLDDQSDGSWSDSVGLFYNDDDTYGMSEFGIALSTGYVEDSDGNGLLSNNRYGDPADGNQEVLLDKITSQLAQVTLVATVPGYGDVEQTFPLVTKESITALIGSNEYQVIDNLPTGPAYAGEEWSYDPDGDFIHVDSFKLTGSLVTDAPTFDLQTHFNSSTGVITWTPTDADAGDHSFLLTALGSSGQQLASVEFTLPVKASSELPPIGAPRFISTPPLGEVFEAFDYTPTFDTTLPAGTTFILNIDEAPSGDPPEVTNTNTGRIEWTPISDQGNFQHYDATELTLTFTPDAGVNQVFFDVVFLSNEYDQYVGQAFIDAFGIFLNDDENNIAIEPGFVPGADPILQLIGIDEHPSVILELVPGPGDPKPGGGTWEVGDYLDDFPINVNHPQMLYEDGVAPGSSGTSLFGVLAPNGNPVMRFFGDVTPGQENTLTFIIADSGDDYLDSTVLISNISDTSSGPVDIQLTTIPDTGQPDATLTDIQATGIGQSGDTFTSVAPGGTATFDIDITGDGQVHSYDLAFVDTESGVIYGTIPVGLNIDYFYPVVAVDADYGDTLQYYLDNGPTGASIDIDTGLVSWIPTEGTHTFLVRVEDGRGGSDVQPYSLQVGEGDLGSAPEITNLVELASLPGATPIEISTGQDFSLFVQVDDSDIDDNDPPIDYVRYYLGAGAPSGLGISIDRDTGEVTWTPPAGSGGGTVYDIPILVFDSRGNKDEEYLKLQVNDQPLVFNQDPIFNSPIPVDVQLSVGETYEYLATAFEPDYEPYVFEIAKGPKGMSFHSTTGDLLWTPTKDQVGTETVVLRVRDDSDGRDIMVFDIIVTASNALPVFLTPSTLPNATKDSLYRTLISAYDPQDDGSIGSVTFSEDPLAPLPAGLSLITHTDPDLDDFNIYLEGVPTDSSGATYTFNLIADDGTLGGLGQTAKSFELTIDGPQANRAPTIDNRPPETVGVGQPFVWTIEASDPDSNPLSYTIGGNLPNPIINGLTISWFPDETHIGQEYDIDVTVTDIPAVGETPIPVMDSFTVRVPGIPQVNELPTIKETPIPFVRAGAEYTFQFEATDPEKADLSWTLVEDIDLGTLNDPNLVLDPNTGLLTWTTPTVDQLGKHVVVVRATDPQGAYSELIVPLTVVSLPAPPLPSNPPSIVDPLPSANFDVFEGDRFQLDVFAADSDSDILYPILSGEPEGMQIYRLDDTAFRLVWNVPKDESNSPVVTFNVIDDQFTEGTNPQTFTINVLQDDTDPTVSLVADKHTAIEGSLINFSISANDNVGIADIVLTATPQGGGTPFTIPVTENFDATSAFSVDDALISQDYDVTVLVTDKAGNTATSDPVTLRIFDQSHVKKPTLAIDPSGTLPDVIDQSYTFGFIVDNDPTVNDPSDITYRIDIVDQFDNVVLNLLGGSGEVETEGSVPPVFINPTVLPNGGYFIRLEATNEFDIPETKYKYIDVDSGQNKIGNFAISFTDLQIPVLGLPLSVTRSYDTTRADLDGEFGYGWQLEIADAELAIDYGDGSLTTSTKPFEPGLTRLVVTLPDGRVESFTFSVESVQLDRFGFTSEFRPTFIPDLGTTSELLVPGVSLHDYDQDGDLEGNAGSYNPLKSAYGGGVDLRLEDGTLLKLNSQGKLSVVVDRLGNETHFTGTSIENKTTGKGVFFEFDSYYRDRITAVIDTNDPNLKDDPAHRIEYTYDDQGNLKTVTNREQETNTYFYEDPRPEYSHFLTGIEDNQGIRVLSPEFYDATNIPPGRDDLIGKLKTLGTAGADIGLTYDLDLTDIGVPVDKVLGRVSERITDAEGVPTIIVRDGRGNVERQLRLVEDNNDEQTNRYLVTFYRYDPQNLDTRTHESTPAEEIGLVNALVYGLDFVFEPSDPGFIASQWRSVSVLNSDGYPEVDFDALGYATYFLDYNEFDQPETIVDANGTANKTEYDASGKVTGTEVRDSNGNIVRKTTLEYDNDQLTVVKDARGNETTTNVYDASGNLTSTEDASGFIRNFIPDEFGRVTETSYDWTDPVTDDEIPLGTHTVRTTTFYDNEGRVTSSTDAYGNVTLTAYDDAGRVKTTTRKTYTGDNVQDEPEYDGFDEVTENFYNVQGQLIETWTKTELATGNESWIVSQTAYDDNGQARFTTDPYLLGDTTTSGTETVYDALGRVIETIQYDSVTIPVNPDLMYPTTLVIVDDPSTMGQDGLDDVTTGTILSNFLTFYNDQGLERFFINEAGLVSESSYDDVGQLEESIQYLTGTLNTNTMMVENIANPVTDRLVTAYEYDNVGQQVLITDALGHSTRSVYDELGRVIEVILHDGTVRETKYNDLGHRVAEIAQYDPADLVGLSAAELSEFLEAITTNYEYDATGQLIAVILPPVEDPINPAGPKVRPRYEYEYDLYGNQIEIRDNIIHDDGGTHDKANERITTFAYDQFNRQVARTLPLGQDLSGEDRDFREWDEYDVSGRLARSIDLEGRTTDYIYDNLGRLDQKHFFDNEPAFSPGMGDPNSLDEIDELVDYIYNDLGQQSQVKQDSDGNLGTTSDQRVTNNVFDDFGRLEQVSTPEGIVNYQYNALGQMERTFTGADLASATTETSYTYDRLGRLETVTANKVNGGVDGDSTTYKYDAVGNLTFVIIAADVVGASIVSQYAYDELYRLELLEHYFDANDNQMFDAGDRRLATYEYEVRADGRRTGVIEETYDDTGILIQTNTIAWVYDGLNRLVAEYFDGEGVDNDFIDFYSYDLVGNRLQKQHDADPGFSGISQPSDLLGTTADFMNSAGDEFIDFEYDDNDRLIRERINDDQISGYDKTIIYHYGENSDLSNDYAGDGTQQTRKAVYAGDDPSGTGTLLEEITYSYNREGRLEQVDINEDGDADIEKRLEYDYNDRGTRVSETETIDPGPGETITKTLYLIDGNNHTGYNQVLEAWDDLDTNGIRDPGELQTSYLLGHDVIAQYHAALAAMQYLLYDGHGSTRGLVDAMGLAISSGGNQQIFAYDAYGNQITGTGLTTATTALTTLLYSGEFSDRATGLQYLRARFYDPATGRFNRVDPFAGSIQDPQSLHKYLYTHADPINGIDPSGLYLFTALNGLQAHLLFYYRYPRDSSVKPYTDTRISKIAEALGQLDPKGLVSAAARPDAVVTQGGLKGFYELKPISHKTAPHLASKTQLQLYGYDAFLAPLGIGRGDSAAYVGTPKPDTRDFGGWFRGVDGWYSVTFYAAKNNNGYAGHDTRGLVYYALKRVRRVPEPESFIIPYVMPSNVRENFRFPLSDFSQLNWQPAAVATTVGVATGIAAIGAYLKLGFGIRSVLGLSFGI